MENFDEEVNSTGNNGQSESSSFSVSRRTSYNNSGISSYDEEDPVVYPDAPPEFIPVKGDIFESLEKCIEMYERYAYHSGFDIRKSIQKKLLSGIVKERYLLCNKVGNTRGDTTNVEKRQRTSSIHVTGCKAKAIFKIVEGSDSYVLDTFEPRHNHQMVPKEHRHLLKKSRQLGFAEMNFIHKVSISNIGATRAHHIYSNIQGSYKKTHGTVTDFKNHKTAIDCYIGLDDAQMLINKMENTLQCVRGFSFNYKVEDKNLAGLFWADETAKLNFKEFGDIISFDATYRTNKYNLIFVPFTAIDNHKKTVSIGAGMLHNEKSDSYKWLIENFLQAFGSQPKMVVTDQDPAMKKAIEVVLPESRHRLCMWHITQKLPSKVGNDMFEHSDFKKKFNDIVWNLSIDTNTFEKKWFEIMKEFGLDDHEWFTHMYSIRSTWIPAYFRDL
uniref:protein FAR1-RELATED SEQUENCE 5-like n=1 Tax=Erigeron canadensis TaxID=72917 RepID=UPI001CB97EC4|nr:protein FAR1-RELATED SEQUENCE 5-like [Erigeron canadensis]